MHLPCLCVLFMVSGGLCAIGSICNLKDDRRGETKIYTGTCQEKSTCLKSGLAAVLKNSDDKRACPDDDESIQCCVDISCGAGANGANQCRNNAEDNPCEIGTYKSGVRSHLYCPFTATDAKLECCVGTAKVDLKARQFDEDFTAALNEADSFDTAYAPTNIPVETPPSNLNLEAYDANPIDISSNHPQEGGTVSVNGNIVGGLTSIAKGNFNLENGGGFSPSINWKSPTDFGSADRNIRGTAPVVAAVPWDTD